MRIKKNSPIDKKIILVKKYSRRSISRKTEVFCRSLDESNTGTQNFGHSKRYKIPFHSKYFQSKILFQPIVNQEGKELVKLDVKEMSLKGAIRKVQPSKGEFVSNLILVKKKDGDQRVVISLKQLNGYIPYRHFKMEGVQNLKYMLQKGDYMCKLDLQDAYFSFPLEKNSRQFVRFRWSGNSYEFLCLCFGLGPAARIFTKLLKVPMTILRRLNIKIIIYLDDMLLIGHSLEKIFIDRDTIIFLLQHLGFVINWKKSCVKTSAGNRVFGPDNQLCHSRTLFKQNKNSESSFRMSGFLDLTRLMGL